MLVFEKKSKTQMTSFFWVNEFSCKCEYKDCSYTLINLDLLKKLDKLRMITGKPIKINSGNRCQRHNKDVGGLPNSKHMIGFAVDLPLPLGPVESKTFVEEAKELFDVVIEYGTFIHCHEI